MYSATNIVFDSNKNITHWNIDVADGPPDYYSGIAGDYLSLGDYGWASGRSGEWTKVPVPATVWLLGLGLAGIGVARRMKGG
ncbi:VPLPA-CTERM sorting domain-containing protein [Spiribacter vilamensis]|uniref:VPLPA-CTERM sorting domain-containing protein n=1 Tax=Spiribacter vilamensis TaxID=531306 RepID=UPI0013EEA7A8